jgi:hypothetical protein
MAAWDGGRPFRSVLEEDPEVSLDKSTLDEAFDLRRSLRHVDRVFAALDQIPPPDRLREGGVTP